MARPFSLSRLPWLSAGLVVVNTLVYLAGARRGPLDLDAMVRWGAKVGSLIWDLGELWRLLTANFVHRGVVHLGLNMLVLLTVGAAIENVYRPFQTVLLWVVSGLGTTLASLALGDSVSVGASGIIFGCLGALVAFGLQYRKHLPSAYRRMFGEGAIPTLLVFLWVGWTSAGVDSAAHLGGLVAGAALAPLMKPRLVADSRPAWWRAVPVTFACALPLIAEAALGPFLPRYEIQRDDAFGISVPIPHGWRRGASRLGEAAWSNGLPGLGRASFAAQLIEGTEPGDPAAEARRFVSETLAPRALGPDVVSVRTQPPEPAQVDGRAALRVRAYIQDASGTFIANAYFVPRGDWVYQLVTGYSASYPRYAAVLERTLRELRLDEPRALREARASVALFPDAPAALERLGTSLRRLGERARGIEALERSVQLQPSRVSARVELARARLDSGETEDGCKAADAALLYGPQDAEALEAVARCALAKGEPEEALASIRRARALKPADAALERAESALVAALRGP